MSKLSKIIDDTLEESKTTTHQQLLDRLDAAQNFEKKERDQWKRVVKAIELERDVMAGGDSVAQKIKYPLVFGAYDNYQSTLMAAPPQVVISSDDRNDYVKTLYWRGIQDHQKRVLRLDDLKYEYVQSFIVTGKAVYKVGRSTEVGSVEKNATDADGQTIITSTEEAVTKNENFVTVVDPRRVWLSPETRYSGPILGDECPYIIEEMIKTPEYIQEKYPEAFKGKGKHKKFYVDELETITINDDADGADSKTSIIKDTDDFKRVRLYAYYGVYKVNGKYFKNYECLFTKKRKLNEREFPYDHGKKPYIYVLNHRKFFQAKGIGALDAVMDLDQEYNEHMNRIRTYIRRMVNPKWAKLKGTKIDEAALIDPDIGLVVTESQANSFRPINPPTLDSAIFDKVSSVEQLFQFLSSITYGQTALKNVGTATGQEIASQGSDTKIARMTRLLERSHEELYTMLLQLEQQYSEGADIKIVGPDIVDMIRQKKKIYQLKMQSANAMMVSPRPSVGGDMMNPDPNAIVPTVPSVAPVGGEIEPPIDEYANFEISPDGRTVYATYSPEDIAGEFELYIVSQSSNRNNQAVRSQQVLKALELSATDPTINRQELWRLWFQLNGETETDRLINSAPTTPIAPPPGVGGTDPMNPTGQALANGVRNSANRTI